MYKVLKLNSISDIIYNYLGPNSYETGEDMQDPDAILVRSAKMHDMELPQSVLCIARAGAGVNNIPIDKCAKRGIVVFNTPGANANGVKELVICGLLLSARKIIDGAVWVKTLKGQGDAVGPAVEKGKGQFGGNEVGGKKLGIIGLGAIGSIVANAALALDMDVTGYDPFLSVESALLMSRSVKRTQNLDEILSQSDYITLHIPLLDGTKAYIDEKKIAQMKDGVAILNFARAELVDEKALIHALDSGKVSRYVTDFPTDALLCRNDVVALPHLGASTEESEENCAAMAAKQISDYIENGNIVNSVNLPATVMPRSGAYRLAVIHENKTNMVGQITAILAAENLNIANMINKSKGDIAYTILDLDDVPGKKLAEDIKNIGGIIMVRSL